MTRLRGIQWAAAVPLFLLGACAQNAGDAGAAASESSSASVPAGSDELVLRVDTYGGLAGTKGLTGSSGLPAVSVYGDGRVITEGPQPAIAPRPAWPNLQVQTLSTEQVQELVSQGLSAGVRSGADYGQPGVADAQTTKVTVVSSSGTQTVTVVGLAEAQPTDAKLTAAQKAARTKLAAFVEKMTTLDEAKGMPAPVDYEPTAVAALAKTFTKPTNGTSSPEVAWPGPALPGTALAGGSGSGCVTVTGDAADKVVAAAQDADAATPWTSGGKQYSVTFRPLLPDEKDCSALTQ